MKRFTTIGVLACAALACARPYPPSGGEQDRSAPRVLTTTPEGLSVVSGFDEAAVFRFDEKLSERGIRDDAVLVSPETGRATIEREGSELKVKIDGGWRPNTVYRIVIPPGVADRFGNARREPAELVFSTGPQLTPTAIAGVATDRVTGRPLADLRVVAISARDSTTFSTVSDSAGFFSIRFLDLGRYTLQAYEDQNRNKKMDGRERRAERTVNISTVRDTQVIEEFALLSPDTLRARLLKAEPRDSLDVRLTFDDFLDPVQPANEIGVALFRLPDSTRVAGARVMTARALERLRSARQDSIRLAQPDTTRRAAPLPPPPHQQPDTARMVAVQELVLVPATPLEPRTRYRVELSNVRNINGLPNGGGSAIFTTRARPAPDTTRSRAPADSTRIRRDTIGLAPGPPGR